MGLCLLASNACRSLVAAQQPTPAPIRPVGSVDLSDERYESLAEAARQQPAAAEVPASTDQARDWVQRIDVWGYVAADYLHTQSGGSFPGGAIAIDQASLFLNAEATGDVSLFLEVQVDYLQRNTTSDIRIGEVYAQFANVRSLPGDGTLSVKAGRFDLPFGEWYLQEDATENAMVGFPVFLPYGFDEGVLVHGKWPGRGVFAAFTEGSYDRQSQDGLAKSVTLKGYADLSEAVYVSASARWQGKARASSLCINAATLTPVGKGAFSTLGVSSSERVANYEGEFDLIWRPATGYKVQAALGAAQVDDDDDRFDRSLLWYVVEAQAPLAEQVTAIVRWSEAGTFDRHEGYRLVGRPYGNGAATFGYDLRRFSRAACGLRWQPSARVVLKAEIGADFLQAIDASALGSDSRVFGALGIVVGF